MIIHRDFESDCKRIAKLFTVEFDDVDPEFEDW